MGVSQDKRTADAVKAYVQAFLSSQFQTWIELSQLLRQFLQVSLPKTSCVWMATQGTDQTDHRFHEPGTPFLGPQLGGGEEAPEFPGNFFSKEICLMLSTYVDDLTLAGCQGCTRSLLGKTHHDD